MDANAGTACWLLTYAWPEIPIVQRLSMHLHDWRVALTHGILLLKPEHCAHCADWAERRACLWQCCNSTATLASVPKASVNGAAPYTSVVQIISKLYVDDYYYGIGGCSGTLSQREDVILTAGHCWQVSMSSPIDSQLRQGFGAK